MATGVLAEEVVAVLEAGTVVAVAAGVEVAVGATEVGLAAGVAVAGGALGGPPWALAVGARATGPPTFSTSERIVAHAKTRWRPRWRLPVRSARESLP